MGATKSAYIPCAPTTTTQAGLAKVEVTLDDLGNPTRFKDTSSGGQQVPFRESAEQYRREGAYSHAYVGGGVGHVFYDREETLPHANPDTLIHTYLSFGDHLGSTSFVIDKDSSELVERAEHQPYGAIESDYRPHRWNNAREDYKFTGKEEDIEIGLTYFGARYYHARLGRWASADPLTIHGLGSDLNPYAYVAGRVSSAVDRFGLDGCVVASYTHGNGTTVEMTESCGAQRASILSMHYPTQAQRDQQLATFVQAQTVSVSKDTFDRPASTRMPGGPGWGRPIDPKQILPGVWNGLVDLYQPFDVMGYFLFKPLLENTRNPESGNRGYALGHSLPAAGALLVPEALGPRLGGSFIAAEGMSSMGGGGGFRIALSLGESLPAFEARTGAKGWQWWSGGGYFGGHFNRAARKADSIHFNLTRFDMKRAAQSASWHLTDGTLTNAEFRQVITSPALFSKTTFYRDGVTVPTQQVQQEYWQVLVGGF